MSGICGVFLAAFAVRPDFGFGNPNTAGALFALLVVAVWTLVMFPGTERGPTRVRFWICLLASGVFGGLLVATASRGALVAAGAGLLACWVAAGVPRPSPFRFGTIVVVALSLGFLAASSRLGTRVLQSGPADGSISSRLIIAENIPAMLVAAPGGWGWGRAAEAYHQWFQAQNDDRWYKNLVSTHGTWLVEMGWAGRIGYALAWAAVLVWCAASPPALGIWVAFGVAGAFSHVGADPRLWVLPGLAFGLASADRIRRGDFPPVGVWGAAAGAGLLVVGLLAVVGAFQNPQVHLAEGVVRLGQESARAWFFAPDPAVLGRGYGKLIRGAAPAAVVFWRDQNVAPFDGQTVVLSGRAEVVPRLQGRYDVIWINPPAQPDESAKALVERADRKLVVWGALRTDASSREVALWVRGLPGAEWRELLGAGLLVAEIPVLAVGGDG